MSEYKRLTKIEKDTITVQEAELNINCTWVFHSEEFYKERPHMRSAVQVVLKRLAEYEYSGLSPSEVADLAKAQTEGKPITLPCKIGDKVYCVANEYINSAVIHEFRINEFGIYAFAYGSDPRNMGERYRFIVTTFGSTQTSHFGKTVFLTQEEAKDALNKIGGGQNG